MLENQLQMSADEQHQAETFVLLAPNETFTPMEPDKHADPLLADRGSKYGAFRDNAAVSQAIKDVMRKTPKWEALDPDMKEALEMNAHKISRILCGDPHYDDSWVDIAGYATRVADRLRA